MKKVLEEIIDRNTEGNYLLSSSDKEKMVSEIMDLNRKKLVQLRTKLEFYKKLDKKIEKVMIAELELDDWSSEVYGKISAMEDELSDLKCEMDLTDSEWDEDESV
jgi:hypothetical protein